MSKWICALPVGLIVIPAVPVYAQSASGDASMGPVVLVLLILGVIVVGSAMVIRRFQFASKAKPSPTSAPQPTKMADEDPAAASATAASVAAEDAA
ncbi:MAG: hypothetical protein AAF730_00870, partial [Bacteroidota bacterium]